MTQDLRPILVTNQQTGEVKSFVLTRAGIYELAKMLATTHETSVASAAKFIRSNTILQELVGIEKLERFVYSIFTYDELRNADYHMYDFRVVNVNHCVDGIYRFESDTFKMSGYCYPKSWKKYLNHCEDCGAIFFDQELIEDDQIIHLIRSSDLGINGHCNDCLPHDYIQCADCGRIIDRYDDDYAEVDGDIICDDCLRNGDYYRCDCCGEWFSSDSYDAQFPGDNCYCCADCAENDGWYWSERYDEWRSEPDNEVDDIITDYHSHDYCPIGDEYRRKNQKHDLYIGRETEVDGQNRYDYDEDYYYGLERLLGDTCFFETDGSLVEGFEIITQPMTEKAFFKQDWDKAFSKMVSDGWRSHDTTTCGTHFHFSKWYLGYTENQQKDSAKKVCRFFQLYADDLEKIARRNFGHYCIDLNNFTGEITSKTEFHRLAGDRYWAVNLTNMFSRRKGTIEIRICKGTLKTNTMLASADFFLHIVRNAKNIAWKNIDNLSLWLKGIKNQNTIDYIKSRHAFVGAF